jgi:hypothetical protein
MHGKLLRRIAAVAFMVGAVAPVTVAVASSGGNAYASGSQVSCTSLKGNETTSTLSKCTSALYATLFGGEKNKKGTATSTVTCDASCSGGWDVTTSTVWGTDGHGGTETSGANYSEGSGCPGKDLTIIETGTILTGSGAAAALVGDPTTATVCVNVKKSTIANEKGTTVDS